MNEYELQLFLDYFCHPLDYERKVGNSHTY
jgi:hypothetical protein